MKYSFLILTTLMIINALTGATRYWVNGNGSFNSQNNWSTSTGGSPIGGVNPITWADTDIAIFDANSGSPTVSFNNDYTIGKIYFSGSIIVTFVPDAAIDRTLTLKATTNYALSIASASRLILVGYNSSTEHYIKVHLYSNSNTIADINGYVKVYQLAPPSKGYGILSKGSNAIINFNSGSTYEYANYDATPTVVDALWNINSNCLITGCRADDPGNLNQNFGNFTWNCPNQSAIINLINAPVVKGNFTMSNSGSSRLVLSENGDVDMYVDGNFDQSGGYFYPSNGSGAHDTIFIKGNFTKTGGSFGGDDGDGYSVIYFYKNGLQTYYRSGGSFDQKVNFLISSNTILDAGNSVIGDANYCTGTFTILGGGELRTSHIDGISNSYNVGCVQVNGTKNFSASANYIYYKNGSQSTGSGLPTSLSGIVTIGSTTNATSLTLTNNITVNNKLILVSNNSGNSNIASGTVFYGSSATLEYQGGSVQTTANREFPASSGPYNLRINNNSGVNLHANRTVPGTLYLTAGAFAIGSDTLTINGSISQTDAGSLTGGATSSVFFGGSTSSVLPGVELYKLVINKSGGITLAGNVTIHNNLTLTSGSITLNVYQISYNSNATLRYNGTSKQTTTNAEFPSSAGPTNIFQDNTSGVDLHADRTLEGNLALNGGNFSILGHILTLNGTISGNINKLAGSTSSRLIVGGSGSNLNLPGITLSELTLQRANGITLNGNIDIYNSLKMVTGSFALNGNLIIYHGSSTLIYQGSTLQTTSDIEFPVSDGPANLTINNASGVDLHSGRNLNGSLLISNGMFSIGNNTLSIAGQITKVAAGTLRGGGNSEIIIAESFSTANIPAITDGLWNLEINRNGGANLSGDLIILNVLTLTNGIFQIGNQKLTLNNPIASKPQNLSSNSASSLELSGSSSGMDIGPTENIRCSQLNNLIISNTNTSGITLNGHLTISGLLQINFGSVFTLGTTSQLSTNILELNGDECLIIKSDASATGSFLVNAISGKSGTVKSERYIEGYSGNTDGWHLISSPVSAFDIEGSSLEPGTNDDLFIYNEEFNIWQNYKQGHFTRFDAGYGYLTAFDETETKYFSGNLNNDQIIFKNLSLTEDRGWHILGNPYPCALIWNRDGLWQMQGINSIAKIFDETINNFIDIEPNDIIPQNQGFVVEVIDPSNSILIPMDSRTHSEMNWHKEVQENCLLIDIFSQSNNTGAQTKIKLREGAGQGFDVNLDAHSWSTSTYSPMLFSILPGDEWLSTNSLPLVENQEIELGFKKGLDQNYKLQASGIETFPPGYTFKLLDKKNNLIQDLIQNPEYSFSSADGDAVDRFKLIIGSDTGIGETEPDVIWIVYQNGNEVMVKSTTDSKSDYLVEIFDNQGKRMAFINTGLTENCKINFIKTSGVYLFRISNRNSVYTGKFLFNL